MNPNHTQRGRKQDHEMPGNGQDAPISRGSMLVSVGIVGIGDLWTYAYVS